MAASDQFYRSQNTLNIVFAVSSLLMLFSLGWMFVQDYNRPFKAEQRAFREVESAVAQRLALSRMPADGEFEEAKAAVDTAKEEREKNAEKLRELNAEITRLLPQRDLAEARYQGVKADLDSITSFYDIATDEHGPGSEEAEEYRRRIDELQGQVAEALSNKNRIKNELREVQQQKADLERPLNDAVTRWKKVNDQFDTQVKLAIDRQWTIWDSLRAMPIIDGFASPVKIQQFTIDNVPIDYNFKYVTRFDRCTSCHLGIDKKEYTRENLLALLTTSEDEGQKLEAARKLLEERKEVIGAVDAVTGQNEAGKLPGPNDLALRTLSESLLTESRVNQFCAHPRMDLFVGPDSKHPQVKFGCTSCHRGQGSGTEFTLSAHTPNNEAQREKWQHDHQWESQHYWDFPMLPTRFVESSCVKCHHEITDLITTDNKNEAPKLVRGYNLVVEYGCYGCHEIHGTKDGRAIGPDLRLEPTPALDQLTPAERAKALADPNNRPGDLRKVGPSLYRLAEKTHADWLVKWLKSPRAFRPDTRMPHFYELDNNSVDVLPDDQKKFPDTEIHAISHFLFTESQKYLAQVEERHKDDAAARSKDEELVARLSVEGRLAKEVQDEYEAAKARIAQRNAPGKLEWLVVEKDKNGQERKYAGDAANGRRVFSERGCLACHRHEGTATDGPAPKEGNPIPAMASEAQFGPTLSQIKEKLGTRPGDRESAAVWLMNWVRNPNVHSPRTRMPIVPMTDREAVDVTAWLLDQPATELGAEWADLKVEAPSVDDLYNLAEVYLIRQLSKDTLAKLREEKKLDEGLIGQMPPDEQVVVRNYGDVDSVKYFVGKKAVGRLGCFACHAIPQHDNAKPIGVGLNDWGKKDAERLTFEDSVRFVHDHYRVTDKLTDDKGNPLPLKDEAGKVKPPYEAFFAHALEHHDRTGFLHLKILNPRAYDYNRLRAWDDRYRMPQFRFAQTIRQPGEEEEAYEARKWKEEADAREAVMTFVLGLVAEQVPQESVNRPTGDRLNVVRGRKVLEKYNCNGCHQLQSGVWDLEFTPDTLEKLELIHGGQLSTGKFDQDFPYLNHNAWTGLEPATGEKMRAHAVKPKVDLDPFDENGEKVLVYLQLARALRFTDKEGQEKDIRSFETIAVSPDAVKYPPLRDLAFPSPPYDGAKAAEAVRDQSPENVEKIKRGMDKIRASDVYGVYGGAFTELLVQYLLKSDPTSYPADRGDSNQARAASPPPLIGQGARTQPDWLFNFLLNPQPVRRMTVLRMPRFNLGEDEARTLVGYFAGVENLTNPKHGLQHPSADMPQEADFNDSYWVTRNAEYVRRLRSTFAKDKAGKELTSKDGAKMTVYDQRVRMMQPLWEKVAESYERQLEAAEKLLESTKEALGDVNDKEEAKKTLSAVQAEVDRLQGVVKEYSVGEQQRRWEAGEAYLVDAYRLLGQAGSDCLTCHQVGDLAPKGGTTDAQGTKQAQGPPLSLADKRLRPEWTERWIANPQRLITYPTPMPQYFPRNQPGKYQDRFAGEPIDQVRALRDVLMAYSRVQAMPVARYLQLPPTEGDAKK